MAFTRPRGLELLEQDRLLPRFSSQIFWPLETSLHISVFVRVACGPVESTASPQAIAVRNLSVLMPPACWFLVLVWVCWLELMLVQADDQQQAEGCVASRCGNLTISHPFWITDPQTGRSCGPMDFKVDCSNNTPALPSSGSLRVVDLHKVGLLQAASSCHAPCWNTSEKLGFPFKVDPVNLDLVLYNCTTAAAAARRNGDLVETGMRCGKEREVFVGTARRRAWTLSRAVTLASCR
ncbi:hypothetical protein ACQ4PT_065722 [Festuca glaucescens]